MNLQELAVVKRLIEKAKAETVSGIPTFNLVELGLPALPLEEGQVGVEADTAAIREALQKGALVQFVVNIVYLGMTFNNVTLAVHGSESGEGIYTCTYAWSPYLVEKQYPMMITIIIQPDMILAFVRALWEGVPSQIDLSALETEGKIVETFADGTIKTTTMEFDESGNPIKITDDDGNETVLTW